MATERWVLDLLSLLLLLLLTLLMLLLCFVCCFMFSADLRMPASSCRTVVRATLLARCHVH